MKVYVHNEPGVGRKECFEPKNIERVLQRVAESTDVSNLAVAVYCMKGSNWRGVCYGNKHPREIFHKTGRKWKFAKRWPIPNDLPEKFAFIRVQMGTSNRYPRTVFDVNGWEIRFGDFEGHLGWLFAHELHHYRRYHLELYPRGGEIAADKWAFARVQELGHDVTIVTRRQSKKKRKPSNTRLIHALNAEHASDKLNKIKTSLSYLNQDDLSQIETWVGERKKALSDAWREEKNREHEEALRALPEGARVRIRGPWPRPHKFGKYVGTSAVKVRSLRRNSGRLLIRVSDGQELLWPLSHLEIE